MLCPNTCLKNALSISSLLLIYLCKKKIEPFWSKISLILAKKTNRQTLLNKHILSNLFHNQSKKEETECKKRRDKAGFSYHYGKEGMGNPE